MFLVSTALFSGGLSSKSLSGASTYDRDDPRKIHSGIASHISHHFFFFTPTVDLYRSSADRKELLAGLYLAVLCWSLVCSLLCDVFYILNLYVPPNKLFTRLGTLLVQRGSFCFLEVQRPRTVQLSARRDCSPAGGVAGRSTVASGLGCGRCIYS